MPLPVLLAPQANSNVKALMFLLCIFSFNVFTIGLAAGETPEFFTELAILVVASAVIAFLSFRIGLTPIIGFLLAGIIIGPNALGFVNDRELIDAAAELGVILLLFTIGIEFSLETLARISRLIFVGGGLQVGLSITTISLILIPLGISWQNSIFTGCLIALSSTAIVMKLLADRAETSTEAGQSSLGILIFQDLAIVAMVLFVPILGGEGGSALSLVWALTKAVGIVAIVLLVARRIMPRVLEAVARTCSPEIFLLSVIAICFGTAYLTSLAGVSLSLGAFLGGLIVSESRFGQQAFSEILPLQILFSAAFFISIGLLLDLQFLIANLPLVLLGILIIALIKTLITTLSIRILGYPLSIAAASGLILAQIGEFSFVLERAGQSAGLSPLGMGDEGSQTFIACTVLLMAITPSLASLGSRLANRTVKTKEALSEEEAKSESLEERFAQLQDHIIIAGYGSAARTLANALDKTKLPYVIATLSPVGASEAETKKRNVVRGDYTKGYILELIGLHRAKLLVIPDDQPAMAHRVISVAKAIRDDLAITAYTPFEASISELKEAGASAVISAERATSKLMISDVLSRYNIELQDLDSYLETVSKDSNTQYIGLSVKQIQDNRCQHKDTVRSISAPDEAVCPECVALGDSWVHLRICLDCGHVGCCDSSKNKHARKHFETTGHPIIKSLEEGETWAYCYKDDVTF